MFTGIVEEVGKVAAVGQRRLTVAARRVLEGTKVGDSLAVNGACLTVAQLTPGSFTVEVMPETLRRTNLGGLRVGDLVNLERALALTGRIGGHLVQGHVDGTGTMRSFRPEDEAIIATFLAPRGLMRYIVEKGFIAVDGVSLTVVSCNQDSFSVSLVTYTQEHTNLVHRRPGDTVNLEVDIVAKYVEKLIAGDSSGITLDTLAEHGFLAGR